jgi:hypothetical protein
VRGREDTEANEGVAECATHAGLRLQLVRFLDVGPPMRRHDFRGGLMSAEAKEQCGAYARRIGIACARLTASVGAAPPAQRHSPRQSEAPYVYFCTE